MNSLTLRLYFRMNNLEINERSDSILIIFLILFYCVNNDQTIFIGYNDRISNVYLTFERLWFLRIDFIFRLKVSQYQFDVNTTFNMV